jgi:hypothetical protein
MPGSLFLERWIGTTPDTLSLGISLAGVIITCLTGVNLMDFARRFLP